MKDELREQIDCCRPEHNTRAKWRWVGILPTLSCLAIVFLFLYPTLVQEWRAYGYSFEDGRVYGCGNGLIMVGIILIFYGSVTSALLKIWMTGEKEGVVLMMLINFILSLLLICLSDRITTAIWGIAGGGINIFTLVYLALSPVPEK